MMMTNKAKCKALTPEFVNSATGLELHQFKWLESENLIGSLPLTWNWLVCEYDYNFSSLHNHLLLYCDTEYYVCESLIFNFWKNIGSMKIEKYNSGLGYSSYISKHLNKTDNNNWEMLSLL